MTTSSDQPQADRGTSGGSGGILRSSPRAATTGGYSVRPPGVAPSQGPAISHEHRDVSGGWLRPAVFGAMDGLVTNVSLIAGVGGGGVSRHAILLTGLA